MNALLKLLPLILLGITAVAGAAAVQQDVSQLKSADARTEGQLREQSKELQTVREDAVRKDEMLKSMDARTKRIEDTLNALASRRWPGPTR